ncbi:Rieske (2Fe-2S) protein [Sessilibacter corallicola]|uniref:Rieske 2Fe-2S domain-containing protein n=1 Tax=Sessilibacter corallicola TaxID=2904075 RepID=A0ABQ0A9M8_9GAMM
MNNTKSDYKEKGDFTIQIDNKSYKISKFCPHRAGRLDHGNVNIKKRTVTCPLHRSVFCLDTGKQIAGPKCGNLFIKIDP